MKLLFYLTVLAVAVLVENSKVRALSVQSYAEDSFQPLIRVARQQPPPPPPEMQDMMKQMPPPPPGMQVEGMNRQKREAKGGGSMPTRKG